MARRPPAARTYIDYDEMLADPEVDAVIVAIADQFHVPAALQAIAAGKHVLVEKPLGVTSRSASLLRDGCGASGLVLQVGNMRRFDPGVAFARDFIRDEIGELLALKAWYCDSTYRYTMTDNLQPHPPSAAHRPASRRRPQGRPRALLPAHPRQPPGRHRALPRAGHRDRPGRPR